jgi:hypothetical protein
MARRHRHLPFHNGHCAVPSRPEETFIFNEDQLPQTEKGEDLMPSLRLVLWNMEWLNDLFVNDTQAAQFLARTMTRRQTLKEP